tara:strand:- start:314 stop:496 length:183 start_codon:yes stop_codon:yes gene_type:complete
MSNKRGGKREGAGRPPAPDRKVTMTFRVDPVVAKWLRDQPESQAALIESALKKAHDIDPE